MCSSSSELVKLHLLLRKSWKHTESKKKGEELRERDREREREPSFESVYEEESAAAERSRWAKGKYEAARGLQANPKPREKTLGDLAIENQEHELKAKGFTRIT
jgi:hypothetical protein